MGSSHITKIWLSPCAWSLLPAAEVSGAVVGEQVKCVEGKGRDMKKRLRLERGLGRTYRLGWGG